MPAGAHEVVGIDATVLKERVAEVETYGESAGNFADE